ncbi:MAG: PhnA domain-containing protein [Rhodospirillales bacterium]|nr:PhnA domain-containing protein [Alphaproteobacteria bacterium]MBL6948466.1 PhnA domain-containing protein [Rhodospirillales bacterium]
MSTETALQARGDSKCELCGEAEGLSVYEVPPDSDGGAEACVLICGTCREQIETPEKIDGNHWRCLSDSMWTPVPAVQVMAWRMLKRLGNEYWAADLLDMLYLDDETQAWAEVGAETGAEDAAEAGNEGTVKHLDSNGAVLEAGDTVTLIKDLNVKGAGFTAKRGTAVRGISLVHDNAAQIEGRVNGQQIVILTEFVRKSN